MRNALLERLASEEVQLVRRSEHAALAVWWLWGLWFDRHHGIETTRRIPGPDGARNDAFVPWFLKQVLPPSSVKSTDVFLDAGSGKGRLLIFAARQYCFKRVIGVEISEQLHRVAAENIHRCREQLATIELVNQNILDWTIPCDVSVLFMYNPFSGASFQRFLDALCQSLQDAPREFRLIYANPRMHHLVADAGFEQVRELGRIRIYCFRGA